MILFMMGCFDFMLNVSPLTDIVAFFLGVGGVTVYTI